MRAKHTNTTPIPDDLLEYDAARWTPLATPAMNGHDHYIHALLEAGVDRDTAAHMHAIAYIKSMRGQL